jgi:hypothetical protein
MPEMKCWRVKYTAIKRDGVQWAGDTVIMAHDLNSLYRVFSDYTKSWMWKGFHGWKMTSFEEDVATCSSGNGATTEPVDARPRARSQQGGKNG